ncbi:hypothetical protein [Devriesea agamarum]|uniref:hypothetical protein n=1 Tax=Devriesea agamarum TaxID=472569 RepID=UPI0012ED1E28|nr:hypothetical protein [Devriesea agamarum]
MKAGKHRKDVPSRRKVVGEWLACGTAFLIAVAAALGIASPYLDTLGIERWRCEVLSAEATVNRAVGNRGQVSTTGVLIHTKNCGDISLTNGVNYKNSEEVAASFVPGRIYVFEVGWFSRVIMMNVFPDGIPAAQSYRLVK